MNTEDEPLKEELETVEPIPMKKTISGREIKDNG